MFLTDLLQKNGFAVRTAENAEEAFRRLAEDKPDLILMDVVMPGQNGFQLTRAITRDPLYADVPIIMCTSKNQETDRVWGMRQGARGYIIKPVDPAELLAKIRRFELTACRLVTSWPTAKPARAPDPTGRADCRPPGREGVSAVLAGGRDGGQRVPISARPVRRDFPVGPRRGPCRYTQTWFLGVANLRGGLSAWSTWPASLGSHAPRRRRTGAGRVQPGGLQRGARSELRAAGRPAGRPARHRAFVSSEPAAGTSPPSLGTLHRCRRCALAGTQPAGSVPTSRIS